MIYGFMTSDLYNVKIIYFLLQVKRPVKFYMEKVSFGRLSSFHKLWCPKIKIPQIFTWKLQSKIKLDCNTIILHKN